MATLVVHPGRTLSFDEFCAVPGPAVALDGFVAGATVWAGDHASFDHHAACQRLATRATCEQVAFALRSACPVLVRDGAVRPDLSVYVNDADPDVAFSWWLLTRPELAAHPLIEHLVAVEGAIDAAGGCHLSAPAADLEVLAWVVDPWAERFATLATATAAELTGIIEEVAARLDRVVEGTAGRTALTARLDVIERVGRVAVVVEHHPLARATLDTVTQDMFVSVRQGPTPGTSTFSLGVLSPWAQADIGAVYEDLNRLEAAARAAHGMSAVASTWGGSDRIGGSPRDTGSVLSATVVAHVCASRLAG